MNAFVDEKTTLIKIFKDNYDISVLGIFIWQNYFRLSNCFS
jgi:hypothetical protein